MNTTFETFRQQRLAEGFDLLAGDTFELDAHVPHAERYGAAGAAYWVARRGG